MFSLYLHRVTGSCAANKDVFRRRPEALFTTTKVQKNLKCQLLSRQVLTGSTFRYTVETSHEQNWTLASRPCLHGTVDETISSSATLGGHGAFSAGPYAPFFDLLRLLINNWSQAGVSKNRKTENCTALFIWYVKYT